MFESGWETLPAVWEWWEALPNVRECSGVSPGGSGHQPRGLGIVGTPSQISLRGGRPFRMSGSCRVTFPNEREDLPFVREWSEALPDTR